MKGALLRAGLGVVVTLGGLWTGGAACAQPHTDALALHWVRGEGAEGCVDGASLAASLERRLGRTVFGPAAQAQAWIEGRVQAQPGGGFEAWLRWVDAEGGSVAGARELTSEAATCDELSEAVAVVIAVMVDPEAALREGPPPKQEEPPVPAPDESPPPEPTAATDGQTVDSEPGAPLPPAPVTKHAAGVVARVGLGSLPTAQVGLGAFYAHDLPHRVRLRIEAVAYGQQTERFEANGQSGEVALQPLALVVSACPLVASGRGISLGLCGGVAGGLLLQHSEGFDGRDQPLGLLQLHGGLRGYWEVQRVRLGLGAAFAVAVLRQRLFVEDEATGDDIDVFTQGPFAAELDASIAVRF